MYVFIPYRLVLKQLTGLESDRRCWHQIGAVLAEKKVGEILPILTMNRDQVRYPDSRSFHFNSMLQALTIHTFDCAVRERCQESQRSYSEER